MRSSLQKAAAATIRFFETPGSPKPLGVFRILIAAFALLQAALWYRDWLAFFGPDAWVQWEITRALGQPWQIHMVHVARVLQSVGISADHSVMVFYWGYVASLGVLLVGWHTRLAAFGALAAHFIMLNTVPSFVYGVDIFLQIALFYLWLMPVAAAYSVDVWQRRVSELPSWGATMSLRILQIHLCFVYLSAGVEKAFAPDWWSGNTLWRSLVQPDFRQYDFTWLAAHPWMVLCMSWFTIVVESGYTVGMWVPRLRILWLAGIISLHAGIGFGLGLYLFGLIMIILSACAFGPEVLTDLRMLKASGRLPFVANRADPASVPEIALD